MHVYSTYHTLPTHRLKRAYRVMTISDFIPTGGPRSDPFEMVFVISDQTHLRGGTTSVFTPGVSRSP
jgi:hypothetical protein